MTADFLNIAANVASGDICALLRAPLVINIIIIIIFNSIVVVVLIITIFSSTIIITVSEALFYTGCDTPFQGPSLGRPILGASNHGYFSFLSF